MAGRHKRKSHLALSGRRPSGILDERKFFLIVTEGKTESRYFDHFLSTTGPRIMSVDKSDSKVRLVEKTIALRSELVKDRSYNEEIDSTWAVFDRDIDINKPNDKGTFNEALAFAERNDIKVAYSNDSFELWFLLHLQVVSTEMHRNDICGKLKGRLGRYEHGDDVFEAIDKNYSQAVKRAVQMLNKASGITPVDANPSTTVHILTEELRKSID